VRTNLFPEILPHRDDVRTSPISQNFFEHFLFRQRRSPSSGAYRSVQHTPPPEHNILYVGDIRNTAMGSEDRQPARMEWYDDGHDVELNAHMDIYEGWGEDYDDVNEMILNKFK